jgi:ankyrin repeat protein
MKNKMNLNFLMVALLNFAPASSLVAFNPFIISPLIQAVIDKDIIKVEELLKNNVDINQKKDFRGHTALMIAAEQNSFEIAKLLLINNANIFEKTILEENIFTFLVTKTELGKSLPAYLELLEELYLRVPNLNQLLFARAQMSSRLAYHQVPLFILATKNENLVLLEFLLGKNADINQQDSQGNTALHHAGV